MKELGKLERNIKLLEEIRKEIRWLIRDKGGLFEDYGAHIRWLIRECQVTKGQTGEINDKLEECAKLIDECGDKFEECAKLIDEILDKMKVHE